MDPAGGSVDGSGVAGRLDEGFDEHGRCVVAFGPLLGTIKADGIEVAVLPTGAIGEGRTVTVSYAVPATGKVIEDTNGNDALSFTDRPVANNSIVQLWLLEFAPDPVNENDGTVMLTVPLSDGITFPANTANDLAYAGTAVRGDDFGGRSPR